MTPPRVLVAGIGNIFLGDDAFGVEVAQRLQQRSLPDNVRVEDFGIRGIDLTYAMMDSFDIAILVDAVPRGQPPGTLYVLEPKIDASGGPVPQGPMLEAHSMDPAKVLCALAAMGGGPQKLYVVGCEPEPPTEDDMRMSLSPAVRSAIDPAIALVESLLAGVLQDAGALATSRPA